MNFEILNDLDKIDQDDQGGDFVYDQFEDNLYESGKYAGLGKLGKIRQDEMHSMKVSVEETGWLNISPNGIIQAIATAIKPTIIQTSDKWKNTVTSLKKQVLDN